MRSIPGMNGARVRTKSQPRSPLISSIRTISRPSAELGPTAVRTKITDRFAPSNSGLAGLSAGRDELRCRKICCESREA